MRVAVAQSLSETRGEALTPRFALGKYPGAPAFVGYDVDPGVQACVSTWQTSLAEPQSILRHCILRHFEGTLFTVSIERRNPTICRAHKFVYNKRETKGSPL